MSSYYEKLKGAVSTVAKQGAQILSGISSNTTSTPSSGSGPNPNAAKTELIQLFEEFCYVVDELSALPNAETIDADIKLSQSTARPILRRIIAILQVESDLWVDHQRVHVQHKGKKHLEDIEIPCLEYVLQSNMIQGIVNRALTDTPRGLMPLVLTAVSHLLRTVDYPLLPHQSVYKSVAKLISFAARYEAVMNELKEDDKFLSYKRRIEIGLTSLLRTIWRKIVDNPPILEFFILTDTRRSLATVPGSPRTKLQLRTQIDILTGLFPMFLEPKVSFYVQETMLTAINLGDFRIISFLADHTNFPETLIKNICDSFKETMVLLQSYPPNELAELIYNASNSHLSVFLSNKNAGNPSFGGIPSNNPQQLHRSNSASMNNNSTNNNPNNPFFTPSKQSSSSSTAKLASPVENKASPIPSTSSSPQPNAQQQPPQQPQAQQKLHPLEKFIRSLLFMKSVFTTLANHLHAYELKRLQLQLLTDNSISHGLPHQHQKAKSSTSHNSNEYHSKLQILCKKISFFYFYEFLNENFLPIFESTTNESNNMIIYYLLKMILLSLSDGSSASASASADNLIQDNSYDILSSNAIKKLKMKKRMQFLLRKSFTMEDESSSLSLLNDSIDDGTLAHMVPPTPNTTQSEGLFDEFIHNETLLSLSLKTLFIVYENENLFSEERDENHLSGGGAGKKKKAYNRYNNNWILLFDRMTSMSKVLSNLSMQVVETVLQISPPIFILELFSLPPIRMKQIEYETTMSLMKKNNQISLLAANHSNSATTSSASSSSTSSNTNLLSSFLSSSTNPNSSSSSASMAVEVWNLRMIEDYQLSFNETLKKQILSFEQYLLQSHPSTATTETSISSPREMKNSIYLSYTIQQLLRKLYHQGDSWNILYYSTILQNSSISSTFSSSYLDYNKLIDPLDVLTPNFINSSLNNQNHSHSLFLTSNSQEDSSQLDSSMNNSSSSSSVASYYLFNDFMIEKYYRRLSNHYFTMKLDEQITFSKLLYDFFIYLSFFIIINPNELINKQSLQILIIFIHKIHFLLNEMESKYLKNIPDVKKKLQYFKQFLSDEAKDYLIYFKEREDAGKKEIKPATSQYQQQHQGGVIKPQPVVPPTTPAASSSVPAAAAAPLTPAAKTVASQSAPTTPGPAAVVGTPQAQSAAKPAEPATPQTTSKFSMLKRSFSSLVGGVSSSSTTTGTGGNSSSHNSSGVNSLDNSSHHSSHNNNTVPASPAIPAAPPSTPAAPPVMPPATPQTTNASTAAASSETTSLPRTQLKKLIEHESRQNQSILTGYLILQEIATELYSFLYAIDYLKNLFFQDLQASRLLMSSAPSSSTEPDTSLFTISSNSFSSMDMYDGDAGAAKKSESSGIVSEVINDYEEDEIELLELKNYVNNLTNSMVSNEINNKEMELMNEYNSLQSALEQLISVSD